jgi:hypothetical protein
MKEHELDLRVYKWFDSLDLNDFRTIQRVFPGKEVLRKVLQSLGGSGRAITKGNCIAALKRELVPADMVELIESASRIDNV